MQTSLSKIILFIYICLAAIGAPTKEKKTPCKQGPSAPVQTPAVVSEGVLASHVYRRENWDFDCK